MASSRRLSPKSHSLQVKPRASSDADFKQHVCRLQVPVQDAGTVQVVHPCAQGEPKLDANQRFEVWVASLQ